MSHLKMASSFHEKAYPYFITVEVGYDPKVSGSDRIYQDNPDYKDYKFMAMPRRNEQQMKVILKDLNIQNYFIFRTGSTIRTYFQDFEDHMLALASFAPHQSYGVDFLRCNPDTSQKKMRAVIRELKDAFAETDSKKSVKFIIDKERKMIKARANNGEAFVQFWRDSEPLRNAPGFPSP